ncbi:MAG: hypothetical protein LC689_13540 [Myxococcales bacterium]|nr:hypothetical protein [Myxococcales bacterium]
MHIAGKVVVALVLLPALAKADEPLRAQDSDVAGVKAEVLQAHRTSDGMLEVRWRWHNTTSAPVRLLNKASVGDALKKETYLLDGANKTKYLVVRDQKGHVLASPLADGVYLKPDQSATAWAKFKAPPADVDKVTVVIPKTPPFDGIPIAK